MWGEWYWPIWLGAALGALLGPEIYALATDAHNTLSWWVWQHLRIVVGESPGQWSAVDALTFGAWMVIITWLTFHFWLRRFT